MMEQDIKERIADEDKKRRGKFWINIVVCGLFGGVIGFATAFLADMGGDAFDKPFLELFADFQRDLSSPFRILLVVSGIVFWILAEMAYRKAKKLWENAEDQDEVYEKVDNILSRGMAYTSVMNIMNFICFGVANYMLPKNMHRDLSWVFWATIIFFTIFVFVSFYLQHKMVNFLKEMNPEKRGSLYDKKFQDKWFESCDEAEKMQIGLASYHAYRAVNILCTGLTAVLILTGMVFEIGILPLFIVGAIWMTQIIVYQIAGYKAQKMLNK